MEKLDLWRYVNKSISADLSKSIITFIYVSTCWVSIPIRTHFPPFNWNEYVAQTSDPKLICLINWSIDILICYLAVNPNKCIFNARHIAHDWIFYIRSKETKQRERDSAVSTHCFFGYIIFGFNALYMDIEFCFICHSHVKLSIHIGTVFVYRWNRRNVMRSRSSSFLCKSFISI